MLPFKPLDGGTTVKIAVLTESVRVAVNNAHSGVTVRLSNSGAREIQFAFGTVAVVADGDSMTMLPNSVEVFTLPEGVTHVAAIAAGTGNTLQITVGDGE